MSKTNFKNIAKKVIETEIQSLKKLKNKNKRFNFNKTYIFVAALIKACALSMVSCHSKSGTES